MALLSVLLGTVAGRQAEADWRMPGVEPAAACKQAIRGAEMQGAIPPQLLASIGRVESGRRDALTGGMAPWPWTINAEGVGHFFDTKAQAIAAVQALQARGVRSIDVGCLQVNLMHHPEAFASLDEAFEPVTNARYAAKFLNDLHDQTGSWPKAAAAYHSQTPEIGAEYQQRVMAVWPEERQASGGAAFAVNPMMASAAAAGAVFNGQGAFMLGNNMGHAHIIPMAAGPGGMVMPGRGLDSYRSRPIGLVTR